MNPARRVLVVSIVLLLFAQQDALAHAAWHRTVPVHPLDADKASLDSEVCDFDAAYAQVLGAAGIAACGLPRPRVAVRSPIAHFQSGPKPDLSPYRWRGPPLFPS